MRAFAHSTDSRGNPAITVLTPSDAVSAYALILAMAHFPSACYLRAVRADLPVLYDAKTEFPFRGHKVLLDGPRTSVSPWSPAATWCIAASKPPKSLPTAESV
jgi:transketolase